MIISVLSLIKNIKYLYKLKPSRKLVFLLGKLKNKKWENAFTTDKKSWGFRRNAVLSDFMSMEEILHQVITTVR